MIIYKKIYDQCIIFHKSFGLLLNLKDISMSSADFDVKFAPFEVLYRSKKNEYECKHIFNIIYLCIGENAKGGAQ